MTKKRQIDFQKTKLRVGRSVPRGRNITDTSFSSNKIIIRQDIRVLSSVSSDSFAEAFLRRLKHGSTDDIVKTLNLSSTHMDSKMLTALLNNMNVLRRVMEFTCDHRHKVRISAINTLRVILSFSHNARIYQIFVFLTKFLSCAMTHTSYEVRQDSLMTFNVILNCQSSIMWRQKTIFDHLIGMIAQPTLSMDTRKHKRTLDDSCSDDTMKAQDWRMKVLDQMRIFLSAILKNVKKDDKANDEQEVYWNDKQPLYIPIYAESGLKPVDIENPDFYRHTSHCYWRSDFLISFANAFFPLISSILIEEILRFQTSRKKSLPSLCNIQNLNTLLQILQYLGKLAKLMSSSQNVLSTWFSNMYYSHISNRLMKNFPFGQKTGEPVGQVNPSNRMNQKPSIELNLKICALYSSSILGTSYTTIAMEKQVLQYLDDVFAMSYSQCFSHVPLLVEITKNYLLVEKDDGIKSSFLKGLCSKLKPRQNDSTQRELQDFFVEISLNVQYKDLSNKPEIKLWYTLLLNQLNVMIESNHIDKKLLKNIRRICCRQHPDFVESLQNVKPEEFLKFLKVENEDFQEAVTYLIYYTRNLSPDFLQDIAEIILLNHSFSFKTASRIIRLLAYRYSGSDATSMDQISYLKFLLNIACDTISLEDLSQHYQEEIVQHLLEKGKLLQNFSTYEILPSAAWERHSRLYKICVESLQLFPEPRRSLCICSFLQNVLDNCIKIPVHCATAILKLKTDFSISSCISQDEVVNSVIHELIFSSILYTSVLSSYGGQWENYGIPEMCRLLDLNRKTVFAILLRMENVIPLCNADSAFLCLRIFGFFITKKLLISDDKGKIVPLLKYFERFCSENADYCEYFLHVCHFFGYFRRRPMIIKTM